MARKEGILITCDRCGNTKFLEYRGTNQTDGGYTTYPVYEKLPSDWMHENAFGYLCPECARKFQTFCAEFFPKKLAPAWRGAIDVNKE